MNIMFTICGRAGSKGLKHKNLKELFGYPLPFYTISIIDLYLKQHKNVKSDIVLNTDSRELIEMVKDRSKTKVDIIEREASLGLDHTPKTAVILNSLITIKGKKRTNYDMIVDLDITSPLRTVEDLQNLINKKKESNADVIFSVTESRRNPYFNMVKKENGYYVRVIKSSYNTRQEAPETFDMNASLYAYSQPFLESGKSIFEGKCDVIKMLDTAVLDIDNESDFELMQVIAEYLFNKNPKFNEVKQNIKRIMLN